MRTMIGFENGVSRLLSAAVVNGTFRRRLLNDPRRALAEGYLGQDFNLNQQEKELVSSIQADSLADFARQVCARQALQSIYGSGAWAPARKTALVMDME